MPDYTVKQGDCLSSIAAKYGLFWEKIWNHPKNARLKEQRKDPNILYPGDVVFVPEKEVKEESGATEQRHEFKKKGVPAKLRIRFFRPVISETSPSNSENSYNISHYHPAQREPAIEHQPIANAPFVIIVDKAIINGQSDEEGMVELSIAPQAVEGKIIFYPGTSEEIIYDLTLGEMDPIDTIIGVRKRLNNLGYRCLPGGDNLDESLRDALRKFQRENNLSPSGEIDQPTKNKLMDIHGS